MKEAAFRMLPFFVARLPAGTDIVPKAEDVFLPANSGCREYRKRRQSRVFVRQAYWNGDPERIRGEKTVWYKRGGHSG